MESRQQLRLAAGRNQRRRGNEQIGDRLPNHQGHVETTLIIHGETRVISGINARAKATRGGHSLMVKISWIGPLLFGKQDHNSKNRT
jgi:hypothetical protein